MFFEVIKGHYTHFYTCKVANKSTQIQPAVFDVHLPSFSSALRLHIIYLSSTSIALLPTLTATAATTNSPNQLPNSVFNHWLHHHTATDNNLADDGAFRPTLTCGTHRQCIRVFFLHLQPYFYTTCFPMTPMNIRH